MALNTNKSGFTFDVESKFKDKVITGDKKGSDIPLQDCEDVYEDKDTPKYLHMEVSELEQKELKNRKINFLTYGSLDDRLTAYAKKKGIKKVAVFEAAITAYLDMVDPIDKK